MKTFASGNFFECQKDNLSIGTGDYCLPRCLLQDKQSTQVERASWILAEGFVIVTEFLSWLVHTNIEAFEILDCLDGEEGENIFVMIDDISQKIN